MATTSKSCRISGSVVSPTHCIAHTTPSYVFCARARCVFNFKSLALRTRQTGNELVNGKVYKPTITTFSGNGQRMRTNRVAMDQTRPSKLYDLNLYAHAIWRSLVPRLTRSCNKRVSMYNVARQPSSSYGSA